MKPKQLFGVFALAFLASGAHAQHNGMHGMDMKDHAGSTAAASHRGSGVVKAIDADKGTVSISHGAIASLNWPAMTMTFDAEDRKLLEGLRPGAKVDFEFVQQGSRYVITSVK